LANQNVPFSRADDRERRVRSGSNVVPLLLQLPPNLLHWPYTQKTKPCSIRYTTCQLTLGHQQPAQRYFVTVNKNRKITVLYVLCTLYLTIPSPDLGTHTSLGETIQIFVCFFAIHMYSGVMISCDIYNNIWIVNMKLSLRLFNNIFFQPKIEQHVGKGMPTRGLI
jgi:hypothetical protein